MNRLRILLYNLAAQLFLPPGTVDKAELQANIRTLLEQAPEEAPWLPALRDLDRMLAERAEFDELAAEYASLFILNADRVPAQPFGSWWLEKDHRLMGASTDAVRHSMARHGVKVDRASGLLPDHVVSELEYMTFLAIQGQETLKTQHWMVYENLLRWIPPFARSIRDARPSPFFRLAADLIEQLVLWDALHLVPVTASASGFASSNRFSGEEHDLTETT